MLLTLCSQEAFQAQPLLPACQAYHQLAWQKHFPDAKLPGPSSAVALQYRRGCDRLGLRRRVCQHDPSQGMPMLCAGIWVSVMSVSSTRLQHSTKKEPSSIGFHTEVLQGDDMQFNEKSSDVYQADMPVAAPMLRSSLSWVWIWQLHEVYHLIPHPKPRTLVRQLIVWPCFVDFHAFTDKEPIENGTIIMEGRSCLFWLEKLPLNKAPLKFLKSPAGVLSQLQHIKGIAKLGLPQVDMDFGRNDSNARHLG